MSIYKGTTLLSGIATETKTNAHSLLDWKWSDHILNEMSWLRGDTFSWQSGSVYVAAYGHLQADYAGATQKTETVGSYTITYYEATDGHKIILPDQETTAANIYNESGVAWYYILDTTNTRFKLPRINPSREELLQVIRAKGNGKALGITDGTDNFGTTRDSGTNGLSGYTSNYDTSIGTTQSGTQISKKVSYGITTDSTKSGIISNMTDSTSVYKGKTYLYFYVGEFSQSATEQTAGINAELFNEKVDVDLSNMNPSATAKETIVNLGIPDYSAGIGISPPTYSTPYTCPKSGCYYCSYVSNTNNSTNHLNINGIQTAISQSQSSSANNNRVSVCAILQKGDIIYWEQAVSTAQVSAFYPFRGV